MRVDFPFSTHLAVAVIAAHLTTAVAAPPREIESNAGNSQAIKIAKDARSERDFLKARRAWAERVLMVPFRERAKDQPWASPALDYVGHALDVWPGDRSTAEFPELSLKGQALLSSGCEDPLVGYLTTRVRWLATDEYYASREAFEKWFDAAQKMSGSRALDCLCGADFFAANRVVKIGVGDLPEKLPRLIAESFKGGDYLPEEDFIFVRNFLHDPDDDFFREQYEALWAAVKPIGLPEWAAKTIHGRVEIERAWKSRGADFSNAVKPEQWAGFAEHLGKARKYLVEAWKARPDQPMASTAMIRLTMGLGAGVGEDDPRVWFDRAITAQCDYTSAYGQYVLALTPRWGGSFDEMIELARACAATARYDTEAPRRILTVLNQAYEEVDDFWVLFRRKEIAPALVSVFRGYADEPTNAVNRKRALAELAVYAHAAGDASAAAKALEEYGSAPLPQSALVELHELGIDEAILRGDAALLSSEQKDDFLKAEKARAEKHFEEARESYSSLVPRTTGVAAARLKGLADITAVEGKLAAGEWATIPADPTLSGWIQRSGKWFAMPDGMPAIKEADGPVRIVYGADVGANFEMRATLKIEGEPHARWFQGLVFGDERLKHFKARWHGVFVRIDKGRQIGTGRYYFREFFAGLASVDCPLLDTNEFTLRVVGGKMTSSANGIEIHKDAPIQDIGEDAHVGFGSFKHTSGITTSLQKLEVRRAPAVERTGAK